MRYVIWGIVGVVLLLVCAVGYGVYWHKYDFKDPQVVANFKEKYNETCVVRYQQRATKSGKTVSDEELAKFDKACSCVRDGVVEVLAKREAETGAEIADQMESDPELKSISQSCSSEFNIQEPL